MRLAITAFVAGGSCLFFLPNIPPFWLLACCVIWVVCALILCAKLHHTNFRWATFCVLFFSAGFAWNAHYSEKRLENILAEHLENHELLIEGRVVSLPQNDLKGSKFAFEINDLFLGKNQTKNFPEKIYLSWQSAWKSDQVIPEIVPGQRWRLKVKLKRPFGTLNPNGFDFERWSFHQNYGASGSVRSGELLDAKDIGLMEFGLRMELSRALLRKRMYALLPKDARYAGVLIALVIGDQNAIEQNDWQVFNATGIGHLISISGLHVTMIAGVGASLATLLWRRRNLPLLIPVVKMAAIAGFITAFIYAWLAGYQIPAQRTMYMVGVVAFALWTGKNPRSFDIWWWALLIVLLIDPMAPYTPGFWLSFGAVAAILYAMKDSSGLLGVPTGKELEMSLSRRLMQALSDACRVQAVVTIALIPITLYWFYQTSIVSPIANAIAIPLVSYVVTPLAILGAFLPDFIGGWLLILAHKSMEFLGVLLVWMSSWDWSVAKSRQPDLFLLLISVIGVVYAIRPGELCSTAYLRLLALLPSLLLFSPEGSFLKTPIKAGEFRAIALDIGQGTAVLIETANRRLLYDAGPLYGGKDDAGRRLIIPYLQSRGIAHIDRLLISHSDSDHTGGAKSLLKEMSFGLMMGTLPSQNALLQNLKFKNIPSIPCRYGQFWTWDDVDFLIWHPHEDTLFQNQYSMKPNEMSCVLEVRNKNSSLWLTGDVEMRGESEINRRLDKDALNSLGDRQLVFMAPHHGSKTSSSIEILEKLNPNIAFAQNGYRNRYGHPHPVVVDRYKRLGIPFFQTPSTGAQTWVFRKSVPFSVHFLRQGQKRLWTRNTDLPKDWNPLD